MGERDLINAHDLTDIDTESSKMIDKLERTPKTTPQDGHNTQLEQLQTLNKQL